MQVSLPPGQIPSLIYIYLKTGDIFILSFFFKSLHSGVTHQSPKLPFAILPERVDRFYAKKVVGS